MSAQPLEARIAHLEGAFDQIVERLGSFERRVDASFAQVDARFAQIDARFNWLIGIILATWVSTIMTILFHK